MSRARFQVFTVARVEVAWRFVASNNRELARSPEPYDDVDEARAAVRVVQLAAADLAVSVSLDPRGRWRWAADHGGDVLAVSSRWYYRRVECEAAMTQFRTSAGGASVVSQVARFTAAGPDPLLLLGRRPGRDLVPPARRPLAERRGPALQTVRRATGGGRHRTA